MRTLPAALAALAIGAALTIAVLLGNPADHAAANPNNCHRYHNCPTATPAPTPTPTPTPPPSTGGGDTWTCTTSSFTGRCGQAWGPTPYCGYPLITGILGGTNGGCPYVDNNVWGAVSGEMQTLNANSPGDWEVINSTPYHSDKAITSFPDVGAPFDEQPMSAFSSIISSFGETMPHNNTTAGWAAFDNWFDNWKWEVMIQHDFTVTPGDYGCDHTAMATFGGSNGVPIHQWGLCNFSSRTSGGEIVWQLVPTGAPVGSQTKLNESSGSVDIKAMTQWLVAHNYMDPNPTITNLSYGWEIATTSGAKETFRVNSYSLLAS
jgi:hypothetical protein